MGKISDALERHKKEKFIESKRLSVSGPEKLIKKVPERSITPELITQHGLDPKLVVLSAPDSFDAENFKVLRSQILFPKNGRRPGTIMITSTFPGEGKTLVAANLAVSIAQGINEHVLLVDCDFRRPSLHKMLGYSRPEGLHEYLTGKMKLPDLLIRTRVEKLSLLAAGKPSPSPSEVLSSSMMREFLEEVKGRYEDRLIIIDAPPSQPTSEVKVLSNYVDGIILVVMANKSPREVIQRNIENLGKKRILGIVFNGYSKSYKSYHKYYEKYYAKDK